MQGWDMSLHTWKTHQDRIKTSRSVFSYLKRPIKPIFTINTQCGRSIKKRVTQTPHLSTKSSLFPPTMLWSLRGCRPRVLHEKVKPGAGAVRAGRRERAHRCTFSQSRRPPSCEPAAVHRTVHGGRVCVCLCVRCARVCMLGFMFIPVLKVLQDRHVKSSSLF